MLPIETSLPQILEAVRTHALVALQAPPGSGKTTRVPDALAREWPGQVLVLEPRRLAARWAARRVAAERGEEPGQSVGYQVRLDDCTGPDTRLIYATQGVLTRRLAEDPQLERVSVLILDEFHERQLDLDLALAWGRRLLPRLRLLIMSATLESCPEEAFRIDTAAPPHELKLVHALRQDPRPLEEQVRAAVREPHPGDTLVFLPGMAEIRRCQAVLSGDVFPLHGQLDAAEQDRAMRAGPRPRIVLATNIAESSVTVEGVRRVIDSGLARVPSHSPWSGLQRLELRRISRSSAIQRAGRAAREGPGTCVRLYSEADFHARPSREVPEIQSGELSELALLLHVLGKPELEWLDPPPPLAWQAAEELLERLAAVYNGEVTTDGRAMARMPLHPRLARLLLECPDRTGARLAAVLADGLGEGPGEVMMRLREANPASVRQLERRLPRRGTGDPAQAVLAAFPDRVAKRKGADLLMCDGTGVKLLGDPPSSEFVVALDVEERVQGKRAQRVVRLFCEIEPEWLLDGATEDAVHVFNESAGRVDRLERLMYGHLVLDETRRMATPGPETAAVLLAGLGRKEPPFAEELEELRNRVRWVFPDVELPSAQEVLEVLAAQATSLKELAQLGWRDGALRALSGSQKARLDRDAPWRVDLAGRQRVKVAYPPEGQPVIASRLADFFGMTQTPLIGGRPALLHLLAPNHRPVQITSDLAGFWERHYPKIRQELCRRYPRHPWPENPLTPGSGYKPR